MKKSYFLENHKPIYPEDFQQKLKKDVQPHINFIEGISTFQKFTVEDFCDFVKNKRNTCSDQSSPIEAPNGYMEILEFVMQKGRALEKEHPEMYKARQEIYKTYPEVYKLHDFYQNLKNKFTIDDREDEVFWLKVYKIFPNLKKIETFLNRDNWMSSAFNNNGFTKDSLIYLHKDIIHSSDMRNLECTIMNMQNLSFCIEREEKHHIEDLKYGNTLEQMQKDFQEYIEQAADTMYFTHEKANAVGDLQCTLEDFVYPQGLEDWIISGVEPQCEFDRVLFLASIKKIFDCTHSRLFDELDEQKASFFNKLFLDSLNKKKKKTIKKVVFSYERNVNNYVLNEDSEGEL